jgi:MoaA/NifB/PqqE/SkfB family radical SAM enzyme
MTGGEVFLRRDALQILGRASELGFAMHVLTNGWLVNDSRADGLMRLAPRIVQLSLDGTPDTHDFLRGLRTFGHRTEAAIARLRAARDRLDAPTKIVIAAVIFRQNLSELATLVRKVETLGADEIKFQPLEQTYMEADDPEWTSKSPLWVTDPEAADRAIDDLIILKQEGWPIQNSIEHLAFMKLYFRKTPAVYEKVRSHDLHFRSRRCRSAVADFDVASNGDVRLCYRMAPIGNVRHEDPAAIWNRRVRCWTAECPFLGESD